MTPEEKVWFGLSEASVFAFRHCRKRVSKTNILFRQNEAISTRKFMVINCRSKYDKGLLSIDCRARRKVILCTCQEKTEIMPRITFEKRCESFLFPAISNSTSVDE